MSKTERPGSGDLLSVVADPPGQLGHALASGVAAPFRMLDPGLQAAESVLAGDGARAGVDEPLARLLTESVRALPDEAKAARLLNDALTLATAAPRLRRLGGRWVLDLVKSGTDQDVLARSDAALMLAVLVAAWGWERIKPCAREGCHAAFIDRTMGLNGRFCPEHRRPKPAGRGKSPDGTDGAEPAPAVPAFRRRLEDFPPARGTDRTG